MTRYLSMGRKVVEEGEREREREGRRRRKVLSRARTPVARKSPASFVMRELMRLVSPRIKHVYSKNYQPGDPFSPAMLSSRILNSSNRSNIRELKYI